MKLTPLSKFKLYYEPLKFRHRPKLYDPMYVGLFKSFKRGMGGARKWYKTHKPKHLEVKIKITLTRIIVLGIVAFNFWPHSDRTIAAPHPTVKTFPKPLQAAVLPDAQKVDQIPVVVETPPPAPVSAPVTSCGSDPLMAYIYQVESGCNTGAYNPGGCRGLGQACPGSKLPCSDSDWDCQDSWFRQYAVDVYGSIYGAYIYRQAHNWW